MATTNTVLAVNLVKGPHSGADLYVYEVCVGLSGAYATGTKPNFNMLTALQAQNQAVSAVAVKSVTTFQDYDDGTNVYTADNAEIVLSSTGNKLVTFSMDSGATDGDSGSELSTPTLAGEISFIVVTGVTGV